MSARRVKFVRRVQYVAHIMGHKVTVALLPRADGKRSRNWWAEIRVGSHSRTPLLWEDEGFDSRRDAESAATHFLRERAP